MYHLLLIDFIGMLIDWVDGWVDDINPLDPLVDKLKAGGMNIKNYMSTLDEKGVKQARDIVSGAVCSGKMYWVFPNWPPQMLLLLAAGSWLAVHSSNGRCCFQPTAAIDRNLQQVPSAY